MLPKHSRLSTKEFALVIGSPTETHSNSLYVKNIPSKTFKFSPTAPKKTFKTAVSRNRIRRRVYAAVREIAKTHKIKPNMVVLIVKKDTKDMDSRHLVHAVKELFVKARLI